MPNKKKRPLSGASLCATVLAADLHGYIGLAERLDSDVVVRLLHEFFELLGSAVLRSGGQVFQMQPASMLAGFGLTQSTGAQWQEALAAAVEIQRGFEAVRASWQSAFAVDTGVGLGIHRGEITMALFGAPGLERPALVGDTVNIATQLCSRSRAGEVLFSAAANVAAGADTAPSGAALLHLPQLELYERSSPLDIWCLPVAQRLNMV